MSRQRKYNVRLSGEPRGVLIFEKHSYHWKHGDEVVSFRKGESPMHVMAIIAQLTGTPREQVSLSRSRYVETSED